MVEIIIKVHVKRYGVYEDIEMGDGIGLNHQIWVMRLKYEVDINKYHYI